MNLLEQSASGQSPRLADEMSARTIFGSLHTAIEYAKMLHRPQRRWVVYKLPKREDFTVCLETYAHDDIEFNYRCVLFITEDKYA